MPHFIIDCSEDILQKQSPDDLMQAVYSTAEATGLFSPGDIKVRIRPYAHFIVAGKPDSFIHVFGYIMEGRTDVQQKDLSTKVVSQLKSIFPLVPVISMNIQEFEKKNYCKKSMV
ncbi:5-carboxymethyl-2-hydroxymuconate Delta-isomerase [Fulvivirga sp. M361]|uniref:5-carboxymethyl-2-hydroxymuconate Delta-isomerase n=1 Tax=Fulvivirga sp. M361 TaxID=2594266 RepID=UPI00117B0D89|nr:5-carboxymethyl-2-hydroxymuconate Delta-isomerase [Fulvivirga sp. M361]TRX52029.1 5-carboxymethyl-2-hydroxymuconate Delta-isomerase [Fulvivirga sp. M361]